MVSDYMSKLGMQKRHPNHNTKAIIKKELLGASQVVLVVKKELLDNLIM